MVEYTSGFLSVVGGFVFEDLLRPCQSALVSSPLIGHTRNRQHAEIIASIELQASGIFKPDSGDQKQTARRDHRVNSTKKTDPAACSCSCTSSIFLGHTSIPRSYKASIREHHPTSPGTKLKLYIFTQAEKRYLWEQSKKINL